MGFIMDGLDAEAYDRQYTDRELVSRILSYFRPHRGRMMMVAGTILLASLVDTGLPIAISRAIDELANVQGTATQAETAAQTLDLARVIPYAMAIGLLAATSWVFNFIRRWYGARVIGDVVQKVRQDAFDAVLQRDLSFFDNFSSGKIVSRITSDTQAFGNIVNLTLDLASQLLLVLLLIGYLFTIDSQLALITLAIAPIVVIIALGFRRIARETITQSRRIKAVVSSQIQETVSGISVAKTFRQEQTLYDEFIDVNERSYRINLRSGYVFSSIFPILVTVAGIGTVAIMYFGGLVAQSGALTPGNWFLFIQGLTLFWFPLTSIASFWSQFQLGLAAGERVFALLDADPAVVQTDNRALPAIRGAIEFNNVQFRYKPEEPVLPDFSLHIAAGETLALVGHTGAGKSSIGKLIARFYEFQGGTITIDGVDIRTIDLEGYRSRLGIVAQTPFLFNGTVRTNIRYGKRRATNAEVEHAARQIGGGDWLDSLPQGLDTPVGERGSSLSMGQRQLVAFARVLLQDPAIFILDEATASVDPLTEALIQEGLETVLNGRTSIVIAHRLSTIKDADRIIVLERGRIIEQGNHDALLEQGGHYAELYNTYFRHQSLEYIENTRNLIGALPA